MRGNIRNVIALAWVFGSIAIARGAPGDTELVSPDFRPADNPYQNVSQFSASADGRFVSLDVLGDFLAPNDRNEFNDCLVRDRLARTTVIASVSSAGVQGNGDSGSGKLSADGRYLVFASYASNLVPHDTNGQTDIFLRDLTAAVTERISVDSDDSKLGERARKGAK